MHTPLLTLDPADIATPLLVVFAADNTAGSDTPAPSLLTTDVALPVVAARWLTSGDFKAMLGETLLLHEPAGLLAERLLIVGLGKAATLTPHHARKGAGVAARLAKQRNLRALAVTLPSHDALDAGATASAITEGLVLADFDIDFYRSDRKDTALAEATLLHSLADTAALDQAVATGRILAESQNFARMLVNEPGNILTPTELGRRAATMAAEVGLTCEVHSTAKLQELGMGAFLAVAQGSAESPALIVLRYEPTNAAAEAPVLGLVGKGITFDTGGISIKPADNMDKMKYDMAGAAAMLGAMRAIALLKPSVRVLSVVCSCENMPDGKAFKPGDVITAMSGKTIEILNTDAEGRLVLADGLHYAQQLGATTLINAATLTGAIGVALGLLNAGLFSNNDATSERFLTAASATGEQYWRMPCTDDYRDQIKSQIADIMNTGNSRYGGSITAAMFLKEFVGDTPWIHLDIAGTAWADEVKPWQAKGPTGIAVRTITEWVRGYTG